MPLRYHRCHHKYLIINNSFFFTAFLYLPIPALDAGSHESWPYKQLMETPAFFADKQGYGLATVKHSITMSNAMLYGTPIASTVYS